jgi:hypothetical protein
VVGPQTTGNGIVAIDPHTTRGHQVWGHSMADCNAGIDVMSSCRDRFRSAESDHEA